MDNTNNPAGQQENNNQKPPAQIPVPAQPAIAPATPLQTPIAAPVTVVPAMPSQLAPPTPLQTPVAAPVTVVPAMPLHTPEAEPVQPSHTCQGCQSCQSTTLQPVPSAQPLQITTVNQQKPAAATGPFYKISVRFRDRCKIVNCYSLDANIKEENNCVVETSDGPQFGQVVKAPKVIADGKIDEHLKLIRVATPEDTKHFYENIQKEKDAFKSCQQKIEEKSLEMKLVEADYSLDRSKIVFYFTAEKRMDFRELVKDLAYLLKARIEMRQIGVRDEAKMLGGYGCCGRELCCVSFLKDFIPVTIKMAKIQHLPLNQTKISGMCGRLMCCLAYEQGQYDSIRAAAEDAVKTGALMPAENGLPKEENEAVKPATQTPAPPQSQQRPRQPWNRNNGSNNNQERQGGRPEGKNNEGQRNNNRGNRNRNNDRNNRQNQNNSRNQNNRDRQGQGGNKPNNPQSNVQSSSQAQDTSKPGPVQGG